MYLFDLRNSRGKQAQNKYYTVWKYHAQTIVWNESLWQTPWVFLTGKAYMAHFSMNVFVKNDLWGLTSYESE